jgi:hypothetical protein
MLLVAIRRSADDDAIFTLSVSIRDPKQKTGCSDLPIQSKTTVAVVQTWGCGHEAARQAYR